MDVDSVTWMENCFLWKYPILIADFHLPVSDAVKIQTAQELSHIFPSQLRYALSTVYLATMVGHCGDCFDVFTGGKWKPTRIEMDMAQEWDFGVSIYGGCMAANSVFIRCPWT